MPQPYKLFTIYAREDAQYLEELRGQLRPLEHAGRIKVWSDREINPGVDWEREIVQNLDNADIILILVSAAYYNSAYIHEKEIKYAISRHERGEAKVLPVIVRPCSFGDDPVISRLQVLPTDGKPVTSHHWRERDDAWLDVVAGVKRTLDIIRDAENRSEQEIRDAAERERLAAERKKEEEKRALQAETDARERRERERREAEQRTREEQARWEREAEATRQREAQMKREREEQERLERLRREQEDAYRRADSAAWLQASNAHDIPAYENYLARYPQGEYAREAHAYIKELRKKTRYVVESNRNLLFDLNSTQFRPLAIRYGSIWAGTQMFTTLIAYAAGMDLPLDEGPSILGLNTLISLLVAIWAIITVIRIHRDQQMGGFIGLSRCVALGILTGLIFGICSAVFSIVYMLTTNYKARLEMSLAEKGMSEEAIATSISLTTNPFFTIFVMIVYGLLYGLIISFIVGLVMKRKH